MNQRIRCEWIVYRGVTVVAAVVERLTAGMPPTLAGSQGSRDIAECATDGPRMGSRGAELEDGQKASASVASGLCTAA
jgi:hypothetical protein